MTFIASKLPEFAYVCSFNLMVICNNNYYEHCQDNLFHFQLTISRKQGQKVKFVEKQQEKHLRNCTCSSFKTKVTKPHMNCFYMLNDHRSDSFSIKIVVVWFKNWPQLFKR